MCRDDLCNFDIDHQRKTLTLVAKDIFAPKGNISEDFPISVENSVTLPWFIASKLPQ